MHQWKWKEEAIQEHDKEKEDNVATEDRVNERFRPSTIVEHDGRNYWKVPQIYGGLVDITCTHWRRDLNKTKIESSYLEKESYESISYFQVL
jgi:hypothetical protein